MPVHRPVGLPTAAKPPPAWPATAGRGSRRLEMQGRAVAAVGRSAGDQTGYHGVEMFESVLPAKKEKLISKEQVEHSIKLNNVNCVLCPNLLLILVQIPLHLETLKVSRKCSLDTTALCL